MSAEPVALKLAEALLPPLLPDWVTTIQPPWRPPREACTQAAAELRRLHAENVRLQSTLDAAVAAARAEERERCETLARYALEAATEGNWAYAAVLLQRIKGEPSGSDAAAIRDLKPEGE